MHYKGIMTIGPLDDVVEIPTDRTPNSLNVSASPEASGCGGRSCGIEITECNETGFKFHIRCDCVALVTWEYDG